MVIRCKLPIVRQLSTKDVLYNTMTTANTAVRYLGKSSHHKEKLFLLPFFLLNLYGKIMVIAAMKLKDTYSLEGKLSPT